MKAKYINPEVSFSIITLDSPIAQINAASPSGPPTYPTGDGEWE